jgi:hypothetical protein
MVFVLMNITKTGAVLSARPRVVKHISFVGITRCNPALVEVEY